MVKSNSSQKQEVAKKQMIRAGALKNNMGEKKEEIK